MAEQEQGGSEETPAPDAEAKPDAKPEAGAKPEAKAEEAPAGLTPPPPGGIADLIASALPDVTIEAEQSLSHVTVHVAPDDIPKVMPVLKDDPKLDLKLLRNLFAVDHQEDGFDVIYQLISLTKGHEVAIKTHLPKDAPKVASVTDVWNAANWHERETRDMFGIDFEGHPHLVPLLLPEDMTDHFPLRKDNPLAEIEEWQADFLEEGAGDGGGEGEEE